VERTRERVSGIRAIDPGWRACVIQLAVSPDGTQVLYVDTSGGIHVIRSDGQRDHLVGGLGMNCCGSLPSTFAWTPDGSQIAYSAGAALHLMNADGTNNRVIAEGASYVSPVWSPDSTELAYVQVAGDMSSVQVYSLVTRRTVQLAAQADPTHNASIAGDLAWLANPLRPVVTWAAWDSSSQQVSGIFAASLPGGGTQRLTPAGATYGVASFSTTTGTWALLDSSATLTTINVNHRQPGRPCGNGRCRALARLVARWLSGGVRHHHRPTCDLEAR